MLQLPDRRRMSHFYYAETVRWFYTAVRFEKEGKPEKLISKCLDRAILFENHRKDIENGP